MLMNKNQQKPPLSNKEIYSAFLSCFVFIYATANAADFDLPHLLIKGQKLSFQCSNGLRFALYPDSGNSAYRKSIQNLSVMIKVGEERKFLVGQQYASNSNLEESPNWGLNVSFSGKTGEVTISRTEDSQFKQLGRYCKRIR